MCLFIKFRSERSLAINKPSISLRGSQELHLGETRNPGEADPVLHACLPPSWARDALPKLPGPVSLPSSRPGFPSRSVF